MAITATIGRQQMWEGRSNYSKFRQLGWMDTNSWMMSRKNIQIQNNKQREAEREKERERGSVVESLNVEILLKFISS